MAVMHGRSWSHLHFGDGTEPVLDHQSAMAMVGYHFKKGVGLDLGAGVVHSGTLRGDGLDLSFDPGWVALARVSWTLLEEKGPKPFVIASLGVALTQSRITRENGNKGTVLATDFRLDLTVGYTVARILRLYLATRAFGGPVFVTNNGTKVQGRDRFFFQIGLGGAILLPAGITVFFEGSPGGEQSISGGVAISIPG